MKREEEAIGAKELHPDAGATPAAAHPDAPPVLDRVEGLNKRAGLVVAILTALTLVGGGVKAISDVNSHFATLDANQETSKRRADKQSDRFDKLQAQQSDDERAEHDHYSELLKHATKTETNVEWIIREMKRGR